MFERLGELDSREEHFLQGSLVRWATPHMVGAHFDRHRVGEVVRDPVGKQ